MTAATCLVIQIPRFDSHLARAVKALCRRHPVLPSVVVTDRDADNVRHLCGSGIDEVVWTHEAQGALWPAIERACARSDLHRIADELVNESHIAPVLRQALAFALRSEAPIRTITQLAIAVGCNRRTLWRSWRATMVCDFGRLEDFLDWLLLLHAFRAKSPTASWSTVAADLGLHEHTLARAARRLTGSTLREAAVRGYGPLLGLFDQSVVQRLIRPGQD